MPIRYEYLYTVSGRSGFPIDMLRHDQSWPVHEADSAMIESTTRRHALDVDIIVHLRGKSEPNVPRWKSFWWTVTNIEKVRI